MGLTSNQNLKLWDISTRIHHQLGIVQQETWRFCAKKKRETNYHVSRMFLLIVSFKPPFIGSQKSKLCPIQKTHLMKLVKLVDV